MNLRIIRLTQSVFAIISPTFYACGSKQHICNELFGLGVPVEHTASLFLELKDCDEVSYICQNLDHALESLAS